MTAYVRHIADVAVQHDDWIDVAVATGAGTAFVVIAAHIAVPPPGPEPGLHPRHIEGDLVGAGIMFGLGMAILLTTIRATYTWQRDVRFLKKLDF